MTEAKYRITIEVSTTGEVATILQAIDGSAALVNVETVPTDLEDNANSPTDKKRIRRIRRHHSKSGLTGKELILRALQVGPKTSQQLERLFEQEGMSGHGTGPRIAELVRLGQIEKVDPTPGSGVYRGTYRIA